MAEVGVLELTIRDNATEAAYGLTQVERKLKDAKTAAEGFDLSPVQSQITAIVQAVKDDSKTVSALGNLFNGIAKFAKVKIPTIAEQELSKLNQLKETLGKGWNLGQAGTQLSKIHDVLELKWNTGNAENANEVLKKIADGVNAVSGTSIKTVANNIGLLADKMEKFAGAASKVASSSGAHNIFQQVFNAVSDEDIKRENAKMAQLEDAARRQKEWFENGGFASGKSMPLNLQFFASKRGTKRSEGQIGMDLEGLTDAKTTVQELTDKFAEYKGLQDESLKYAQVDPSQFVAKPLEAVADVQQRMAEVTERMTGAVGAALPKVQQLSSEEMIIAGNAKQAAEAIERLINRLNTVQSSKGFSKLVDIYTGVTRNNTNLAESSAEAFASAPVEYFNNALQKTGDILSGVVVPKVREMYQMLGEMSDNLGWFKGPGQNVPKLMAGPDLHRPVDEDKMLSTYVDDYKPNWTYYDPAVAKQAAMQQAETVQEQTRTNPAVGQLLDRLNNPENANRMFSEIVDTVTGVVRENANHIDPEQVSLLSIPAMDKEGPFEMASEEIAHYLPLLKRAREDLGFWGDKYEEVQKRIKYNGSTLEREQMLGQAEKGFYFSLAKVEEYEAALKRVYDYTEKYQKSGYGMGNIKGIYEDARFGPTLAGLNGVDKQMELIGQIASNTGLSIDNVKQQLAELSHGTIQFGDDVHKTDSAVSQASKAGMEQFKKELEEITESTTPAMSKIELLRNKVTHLWSRVTELSEQPKVDIFGNDNGINNTINEYLLKIGRVNEQLQKLFENAHKAQQAAQFEEMKANSDDLQRDYGTEMVDNIVENYSQLDLLKMKMEGMKQALADDIDQNKVDTQQIAARTAAIQKLQEQIDILNNKENADNLQRDYGEEMVGNMMNNYNQIDLLTMKMDGLKQALADDINQNKVDTQQIADRVMAIQNLQDKIKALTEEQENANSSTWSLTDAYASLKTTIKKMFPTITGLLKRFKSMAIMRGMRYIIRQLAAGVSEGIKNVYEYSKAVGTDFAPSMDSAASALLYMKNSIGAALAPAIQALIPVLRTVVNWFVSLVNIANQFVALLTGHSTWTQAIETQTEAYTDNSKKAKQAAKDAKDLLADWDELNIIQSQSGGGGSGTSGKTQPDYSSMFQQVNEFNEGIKRVVDFVNDHMHGLLSLVGRIAAIIYGMKFSKLFTGWLGKLGKIVAGASLITIGLELSYGSSFEAGKKGYFDTTDLLGTIGGVISSGIGGYMIGKAIAGPFGGKVGLVIGLGVGIIAAIKGYIDGKKDAADAAKWGNLHKTQEEIEEFVKKQFSFDVEASITILDASIENQKEAEQTFRLKVNQFSASLGKAEYAVTMHVDKKEETESIQKAFADSKEAIAALQAMLVRDNEGLTVLFKEVKFKNASGEDINDEIMANVTVGDTFLNNYFKDLGKQAADLFYEGQRNEWANGEDKQILALFNSQNNIMSGALELKDQMEFNAKLRSSNNRIIDRDTAEAEMQYQKEQLDQYRQKVKEAVLYDADQMLFKAAMSKQIWEKEFNNGNMFKAAFAWTSYKLYEDSADNILNDVDRAVEERLGPTKEKMKEDWGNVLREVYGSDFSDNIGTLDWLMGSFTPEGERASEEEIDTIAGFMKDKFNTALAGIDTKKIMKNATEEFGMNLWTDFFNEAQKQDVFDATVNFAKNPKDAALIIMKAFGIDAKAVYPYLVGYEFRPIANGITEGFQNTFEKVDAEIKKQNYSEDLIKDFVSAGIDFESEFKKQNSGHSLIDWVNDSKDAGENKNHYMRDFLGIDDSEQVTISIVPVLDSKDDQQWLLDWLAQEGDKMTALLAKESSNLSDNLQEDVGKMNAYSVPAPDTNNFFSVLDDIERETHATVSRIIEWFRTLSGVNVEVNASAGMSTAISGFAVAVPKAKGGFVKSADLVMANENGEFEMMGKMGNQPVVANNQQIVSGISRGVSEANGDVVGELRTVTTLMQRMLAKRWIAESVPSSRAGRANQQSADAYAKVTG